MDLLQAPPPPSTWGDRKEKLGPSLHIPLDNLQTTQAMELKFYDLGQSGILWPIFHNTVHLRVMHDVVMATLCLAMFEVRWVKIQQSFCLYDIDFYWLV